MLINSNYNVYAIAQSILRNTDMIIQKANKRKSEKNEHCSVRRTFKYPEGVWQKASEIYISNFGMKVTPEYLRRKHYSTFDPGIQEAIDEAIKILNANNN